jgi:hypothetical protein
MERQCSALLTTMHSLKQFDCSKTSAESATTKPSFLSSFDKL